MEATKELRDNGTTNWIMFRAFGNVTERIGSDLTVECTSNTYKINVNLVKREASRTANDPSQSLLSQSLVLHILKNKTTNRVVYGQFRSQLDDRISDEIDDCVVDFMEAIENLELDHGKNLLDKFFASIPHTLTLQGTLSLVKDSLTSLKLQQLECDKESPSLTDGFQERNVFLIDEDSGSECSLNELNIEEPDPGMLLLGSDSKSPTIDLAEEDEHKALAVPIAKTKDELIENQEQPEPSINFETISLVEEKQPYPSLQSTLLEWLIQHYYRPIYNISCAEQIAWDVVTSMKKLSIDIETLYDCFRNVINQGLSLDYFSSFLMSLKGFSDSEDKLLIADFLDPVLAFLVASLLPNKVLTRGLQNALKGVKVEKGWTRNVGIISDVISKFGVIISDVGYVFFDKNMLKPSAAEKIFRRNLVFFNSRKFSYQDVTWGVASKVCRVYEGPLVCETTEKFLKPCCRPAMDLDVFQRHSTLLRGHNQLAYENAVIEEFSRPIYNRKSIDVLIIDSDVSKSLEGLQFFLASSFGGTVFSASAAVKSNLYASVWARLGFTEKHLLIDYRFLYSFGGESCVYNSWLSLLYLVELPQSVNPLELIRLTIAYYNSKEKPTCMNYFQDFDKFNFNRAIVENLIDELLGHRTSHNPIVLEPFKSPSVQHSAEGKTENYNETLLRQTMELVNPLRQSLPVPNCSPRFQYPNPPFSMNLPLLPPSFNGMEVHPPLPFPTPQRPFAQTPLPFITSRGLVRPHTSMVFAQPTDAFLYQPQVQGSNYRTILVKSEIGLAKNQTLPIDPSGCISSSTLVTCIPGASSIMYRLADGPWQHVKKFRDTFVAPPGGWEHYSYLVS